MTIYVTLANVKRGDLVWESEAGQDALLLALGDAQSNDQGCSVNVICVQDGKHHQLFAAHGRNGYGPKLYTEPQYTRPNYQVLLAKLAKLIQEVCDGSTLPTARNL